jgi:hypothetical protein
MGDVTDHEQLYPFSTDIPGAYHHEEVKECVLVTIYPMYICAMDIAAAPEVAQTVMCIDTAQAFTQLNDHRSHTCRTCGSLGGGKQCEWVALGGSGIQQAIL